MVKSNSHFCDAREIYGSQNDSKNNFTTSIAEIAFSTPNPLDFTTSTVDLYPLIRCLNHTSDTKCQLQCLTYESTDSTNLWENWEVHQCRIGAWFWKYWPLNVTPRKHEVYKNYFWDNPLIFKQINSNPHLHFSPHHYLRQKNERNVTYVSKVIPKKTKRNNCSRTGLRCSSYSPVITDYSLWYVH